MKILLCASETVPFAKTGGLADVAGSLPKALAALGHDVRIVMPKYASVDEKRFRAKQVIERLKVPFSDRREKASVWSSRAISGVTTYFIDNPRLFRHGPLYGHNNDAERFIFYQRAALEMLPSLDWIPEVIHCNDWQSGLIPLYLSRDGNNNSTPVHRGETAEEWKKRIATIYTVHNLGYQGNFPPDALQTAGLPISLFGPEGLEFYGAFSFMKAGLLYADLVTTVSPTYAQEIQTEEYGEKMEGVLRLRSRRLRGILNGLDYGVWDPSGDPHLASNYTADNPAEKAACKKALQSRLGLATKDVPVIGLISRLAAQKGFDLLEELLPHLLKLEVQIVVLGLGEKPYEKLFKRAAKAYPEAVSVSLEFNEELAHQIYAGSDVFLMPSRYEPCGLGQLISLRYGTVPVVRATGGLADTVEDFDPATGKGNGFRFQEYSSVALLAAISRALLTYRNKRVWKQLVKRGMKGDFSWQASAKRYEDIYQEAVELHGKQD